MTDWDAILERFRESEQFDSKENIEKAVNEWVSGDQDASDKQQQGIEEAYSSAISEEWDNSVQTTSAKDIEPEDIDASVKGGQVETSQGKVDVSDIKGSFKHSNGNTYLMGKDGKIKGTLGD